jgi:glutamate-1-semialdehyde 2,1-aminomutase
VGHLNAANLPQGYPQFFASGEGATLLDVDGRRSIDFMCAWGRIIWVIAILRSKRPCSGN